MTLHAARFLAGLGAALGLAACGNLSNEDLVFLSGVPSPEEVALEVEGDAGGPAGALIAGDQLGAAAQYYVLASQIAEEINGGARQMLEDVRRLGEGHTPSLRQSDRRVWGPLQNVDGSGLTYRLEISRSTRDDGGPRFAYCLQLGRDADYTGGEGSCAADAQAGLTTLLSGFYDPARTGGVRAGAGEVHLDFTAAASLGASVPSSGAFTLVYDFSDAAQTKIVDIDWLQPASAEQPENHLDYSYRLQPGGAVEFFFEWRDDAIQSGAALETSSIRACWQIGGPGKAFVNVRDGDLLPGHAATATECWDAQQLRTFLEFNVTQDASLNYLEAAPGYPADCPDC